MADYMIVTVPLLALAARKRFVTDEAMSVRKCATECNQGILQL